MKLIQHNYGKAKVRVLKVFREGKIHSIKELDVQVMLQGNFDASYTKSDNRLVVATDSIKNTVNVLAKERMGEENEEFGTMLGEHFLKTYSQIARAEIILSEHCWTRISIGGKPHAHSFLEKSAAKPFARIIAMRKETTVESGIEELFILKTTGSGFENFLRDEFTILPETSERICATKLKATWTFANMPTSYSATNSKILDTMLATFAINFSPSVQVTLFQMGEAALKAAKEISKIHIAMPNKHCLLINLKPFGLENKNELFVPTDEPHGQIEGTVSR
ncbi:MAG TPA: urate oxidase [Verrucomicrobiae bacterium]|jgi:urate oxidase|nr:urate oxidase [Verrucomicrobiae bacterium]